MSKELQAQLNAETEAALPRFDELLDFALDAMLDDRTNYDKHYQEASVGYQPDEQREVVKNLGLWTVNEALDQTIEIEPSLVEFMDSFDVLKLPMNTDIQAKIEAFGKAVLDEAFNCLGEEAPHYASLLRQAKTDKDRTKAVEWLFDRLYDIQEFSEAGANGESDITEDQIVNILSGRRLSRFYHPLRLSPKMIGQYPLIMVEPTCLGYSILASAFFERAGVPYLHTGIARTSSDEARSIQNSIMGLLIRVSENIGVEMPNDLIAVYAAAGMQNIESIRDHNGFHAAVYARLSDRMWVQVDPNYHSNILMTRLWAQNMNASYSECLSRNKIARGSELTFTPEMNMSSQLFNFIIALKLSEQFPDIEEISQSLDETTPENFRSEFITKYFRDFFTAEESFLSRSIQYISNTLSANLKVTKEELLQDIIFGVIEDYVFTDAKNGNISACIDRCRTDQGYKRRISEALAWTPLLVAARLQSKYGNTIIEDRLKLPHTTIDAGIPAYRIGMAILSDLAVYCGDQLPLSFWMTYWPSQISFAEHYANELSQTDAQTRLKTQIARDLKDTPLKYGVLDGIVDDVLE
ncbi:MAG TPA: hypothetical protein VFN31_01000 [Candidatus Saccharimonadales bacterium]|nr:hypothetical protein [Candidatus Saccharimonadales bacterium]